MCCSSSRWDYEAIIACILYITYVYMCIYFISIVGYVLGHYMSALKGWSQYFVLLDARERFAVYYDVCLRGCMTHENWAPESPIPTACQLAFGSLINVKLVLRCQWSSDIDETYGNDDSNHCVQTDRQTRPDTRPVLKMTLGSKELNFNSSADTHILCNDPSNQATRNLWHPSKCNRGRLKINFNV